MNGFRCDCALGFEGELCEENINECLEDPCRNRGTCEEFENTYKCFCQPGYEGKNCEININECEENPCLDGSTCIDLENAFECQCLPGTSALFYKSIILLINFIRIHWIALQ